jgi:glycerol-3-phosphate dehydrogenase
MMPEVCKELDIPYGKVGTLTVAIEDEQIPMLQELLERAKQNGVKARLVSADELKKMEPNINPEAKGALLCPDGGIVNPFLLPVRAMENAMDNGAELHLERRGDRHRESQRSLRREDEKGLL